MWEETKRRVMRTRRSRGRQMIWSNRLTHYLIRDPVVVGSVGTDGGGGAAVAAAAGQTSRRGLAN